jgi:hypothetical protein
MLRRIRNWTYCTLLGGGLLLQSCPVNSDDVQEAAASSAEIFLTDLFNILLNQLLETAFDVAA